MDKEISPELQAICEKISCIEYLERRGHKVYTFGHKSKCACPLPGHEDSTPSFYIYKNDSGEVWKCFGCGKSGNIITLIHLIEQTEKFKVVTKLKAQLGINGEYKPEGRREKLPSEYVPSYSEEDRLFIELGTYGKALMQKMGGTEDIVNKVSLIYQRADKAVKAGDKNRLRELINAMLEISWLFGSKNHVESLYSGNVPVATEF